MNWIVSDEQEAAMQWQYIAEFQSHPVMLQS